MRRAVPIAFALMFALHVPTTKAQSAPPRKDIPAIAKAANGAIVSIVMSDKDSKPIAQGSGFLVSKDGFVVTNYHVIAEGNSAIVKLPDGAFYLVDGVVASDKVRDIAVIKTNGKNFRTLTLGNSDRLQVGEEVVAIGNPLSLESSVSNGIVSGIRVIKEEGKYLQITAPISHGSSGGPLFNMAGEVIGITAAFLEGGENLNFAIPINEAKRLLLNHSARLQNLPNEAPPVAKVEPSKKEDKRWTSDLFGGEYRIEIETGEIRITTIRPPNEFTTSAFGLDQENFSASHNIILDLTKDVFHDHDGHDDYLGGPLRSHLKSVVSQRFGSCLP